MTTPKITIKYAWKTPWHHGPTWESQEEAEDQDKRDAGMTLLKLYVNSDGKVVHTEVVT